MDLAILEQQALELSAEERAVLAQHLLASLDQDAGIEEAWAAEVERRVAEVETGAVQVIPISEALAHQVARLVPTANEVPGDLIGSVRYASEDDLLSPVGESWDAGR